MGTKDHVIGRVSFGFPDDSDTSGFVTCICGWSKTVEGFDPDGISNVWSGHRRSVGLSRGSVSNLISGDSAAEGWNRRR